jgi:DNA-binding transcriptional MerR regulator
MSEPDLTGLVPAAATARLFGCVLRTLSNWEKAEVLIPVRIRGRRYYRLDDIQKLLAGLGQTARH